MGCDPALEAAFVESWDRMVRFHADWSSELITFIVSRSREHGMQQDQPSVALEPQDDRLIVVPSWRPFRRRDALAVGYECDPRLTEILDELVSRPIT